MINNSSPFLFLRCPSNFLSIHSRSFLLTHGLIVFRLRLGTRINVIPGIMIQERGSESLWSLHPFRIIDLRAILFFSEMCKIDVHVRCAVEGDMQSYGSWWGDGGDRRWIC